MAQDKVLWTRCNKVDPTRCALQANIACEMGRLGVPATGAGNCSSYIRVSTWFHKRLMSIGIGIFSGTVLCVFLRGVGIVGAVPIRDVKVDLHRATKRNMT